MGQMRSAAAEQDAGIGQVGRAVAAIDATTQHNAALVEQTAAASSSLEQQAQALVQAMSIFTLRSRRPALPLSA